MVPKRQSHLGDVLGLLGQMLYGPTPKATRQVGGRDLPTPVGVWGQASGTGWRGIGTSPPSEQLSH
jgi:hypothetical protein